MADAKQIHRHLKRSTRSGFTKYTLTLKYRIIMDEDNLPETTILATANLPQENETFALTNGVQVVCVDADVVYENPEKSRSVYIGTFVLENDSSTFLRDEQGRPVTDLSQVAKRVDVTWEEYQVPTTNAELINETQGGPFNVGDVINLPSYLNTPNARIGAIRNSAGEVFSDLSTEYRKVYTVWKYFRNYEDSWDDYVGKVNDKSVTITESDKDGVRATYYFDRLTLLMRPFIKQEVWQDSRLFFKIGFVFAHNPNTWVYSLPDVGQRARIYVGQKKNTGATWQAGELPGLTDNQDSFVFKSIIVPTDDGEPVAAGEPVQLNGHGAEMPINRSDNQSYDKKSTIFLNYWKNKRIDFRRLNL